MENNFRLSQVFVKISKGILLTQIAVLNLCPTVLAQDNKAQLSVDMTYHMYSDSVRTLDVQVFELTEEGLSPRNDVLCNLYLSEISREGMMGSMITDQEGKAVFPLVNKFRAADDTISEYQFIIRIANDERFVSIDDTSVFEKAKLEVDYFEDDLNLRITSKFHAIRENVNYEAVKGLVVKHFVKVNEELTVLNGNGTLTDNEGVTFFDLHLEQLKEFPDFSEIVTKVVSPMYGTFEKSYKPEGWGEAALDTKTIKGSWDFLRTLPIFAIMLVLILPTVLLFVLVAIAMEYIFYRKVLS